MKSLSLFGNKTGRKTAFFSTLLLFAVLFTPRAALAMTQVKLAVFNFVTLNMESSRYGTVVTNMLGDAFKIDPSYDVLDRKDLEAFLNLNDYQQDDKVENAVNIGTRLGLNVVIVGSVEKKDTVIIVNCKAVLVEQKKVILNHRMGGRGEAGLAAEVRRLAGLINGAIAERASKTTGDEQLKVPVNVQKRSGNKQVFLSWEYPLDTNADGYDIFRSNAEGGPFAKVGQVNQREYLDKNLEKSTTYYYKIKAFKNSGQQSGFTEVIAAETSLTPNPPVIHKVESKVRGVQVTCSPNTVASGDPLKLMGYKLFRAKTEQGTFKEVADLSGTVVGVSSDMPLDKVAKVTYVDKNLGDGEVAYYRLTIYNEKKMESSFSGVVKGAAIPVISGLSAKGGMVREIKLTWNAIDSPHLRGYNIYRNTKEGGDYIQVKKLENSRGEELKVHYADREGLADNFRYYYRVTAYDDTDQQTAPSVAESALTKPRPVKPAGLRGESLKVKSVPLTWLANPEKDIVLYHVYRKEGMDGSRFSNIVKVQGGGIRYQDRDLQDGVSYAYKIQAEDKDGVLSDFSDEIQISTKPKPKSPEGLTGEYLNGTVTLTWKPGVEPDIAFYKIYEKSFWGAKAVPGLEKITSPSVIYKVALDKEKKKTYLVTAVDRDGLESAYGPGATVTGK